MTLAENLSKYLKIKINIEKKVIVIAITSLFKAIYRQYFYTVVCYYLTKPKYEPRHEKTCLCGF